MTRFRGHLNDWIEGVHDGEQSGPVYPGIQAADGGSGAFRTHPGDFGERVRPDVLVDLTKRQSKGDGGLTSTEREELSRLRRENRKLKEEREILSKAAAWFATEGAPSKRSSGS